MPTSWATGLRPIGLRPFPATTSIRIAVLGPYREEPKETSIHLARTTDFAGIHPQKRALLLNLRTQRPIDSTRVIKCEQVSKDRYHNEIRLTSPNEVDAELNGWLREAYKLG